MVGEDGICNGVITNCNVKWRFYRSDDKCTRNFVGHAEIKRNDGECYSVKWQWKGSDKWLSLYWGAGQALWVVRRNIPISPVSGNRTATHVEFGKHCTRAKRNELNWLWYNVCGKIQMTCRASLAECPTRLFCMAQFYSWNLWVIQIYKKIISLVKIHQLFCFFLKA